MSDAPTGTPNEEGVHDGATHATGWKRVGQAVSGLTTGVGRHETKENELLLLVGGCWATHQSRSVVHQELMTGWNSVVWESTWDTQSNSQCAKLAVGYFHVKTGFFAFLPNLHFFYAFVLHHFFDFALLVCKSTALACLWDAPTNSIIVVQNWCHVTNISCHCKRLLFSQQTLVSSRTLNVAWMWGMWTG